MFNPNLYNIHHTAQEQPDARRPLVAQLKTRLMQLFPEMAMATYPHEIFVPVPLPTFMACPVEAVGIIALCGNYALLVGRAR